MTTDNVVPPAYRAREVRSWAALNGWPRVAGRNGRLPRDAINAYTTRPELTPPGTDPVSETPGASVAGDVPPLTDNVERGY